MKYLKHFENYDPENTTDTKLGDSLNKLQIGIRDCPSVKHLFTDAVSIEDTFNVYGTEAKDEIITKLEALKPELEKSYDLDDAQYLTKDENGLKFAPTTQIKNTLTLFYNL
jgi:hypothetical protein